jgi:tripartite-type tricarboxylate transporter receptor subunit TctC
MSKILPLLSCLAVSGALCGALHAAEQRSPTKPIRVIIPTTPGGGSDDMREMMARAGVEPLGNTPAEAMAFLKVEIARWGKVIRMANVKVD